MDTNAAAPAPRRYGQLAKQGVAWSFVREAVSESLSTPTAMITARLLTPFDFGVAASAAFFLTFATRVTNLGFNQALVRVKHLRPEHCSSVFVINLATGIVAYGALAASGPLLAAFFRAPQIAALMPIAALTFLISPLGTVPAALMSRDMRFRHTALCDWLGGLTEAVTAIALALAGYGYWSLVYCRVAGDIVNTTAKVIFGRWRPSLRFSPPAAKELLSFGTGVFVKRLLDYSANHLDNMVVGRALGVVPLGFYDKAFVSVRKVLVRLNTGGPVVSFRVFSLIHEERERFRRAYRKVVLGASLLSYPVLLGLAAAAPDLIPVMYGDRWRPAVLPFQILCLAGTLKVLNEYAGSAVQAAGKIWGQVWRQAASAGLLVVVVTAFCRWGLPGAAAGVLVATTAMSFLMHGMLMHITGLAARHIVRAQIPGVLCGVGVGTAVITTRWMFVTSAPLAAGWQRLIVEVAIAGVFYAAFIKFNRFREVRRLVRDVAADLTPAIGRVVRLFA